MTDENKIRSKALIYEQEELSEQRLKKVCEEHAIIGLKASHTASIELLNTNTDLGAVFISSSYAIEEISGEQLVQKIHQLRPELPIFLRLDDDAPVVPDSLKGVVACTYTLDDLSALEQSIHKHIFSTLYPMPLVRGIQEISLEAIKSNIRNCNIKVESPYLVKDQIIYGELMSLIPIESNWYRGYMMLQTTEKEVIDMIRNGMTPLNPNDTNYRYVNSLLNEVANMIWGGIKNRFAESVVKQDVDGNTRTQVPISVNHFHKYISFGTTDPQLCFYYQIENEFDKKQVVDLYQKFVFNLSWYPENFQDSNREVDKLVESGELEFF